MIKTVSIIGFNFVNSTMKELLQLLDDRISTNTKTFIVTANPEIVTYANSNKEYKSLINDAHFIIPDGVGIIWAAKILGNPLVQRLPGFELMEELLKLSNDRKYSIYFLGTKPNLIDKAVENINTKYPKIKIVGFHHGYFDSKNSNIADDIARLEPDIVFVGTGFPKQEKWIAQNIHKFNKGIFIGVGGCFNVWAGYTKRAPKPWRDLNLEWAYRIINEPTRLKRAIAIPKFMINIITEKYRS
ncbi:WecB/TagA/CpsF family glycosyltransferase [Bacillus alkalisoli]|uniref:WecB/TagA/CpsF family glycosyltransferase n=1 Tax=Bacillus alkalisoli TaxID=2011008 RepID=UPI000C24D3BB|nr:WecB/TagA/CpsF family glycosyltransferase [Bacillus alkalisoli]